MSVNFLDSPIEYLQGVGPIKGKLLKSELDIATFGDLLWHLPFRYIDKSQVTPISALSDEAEFEGKYVLLKGEVRRMELIGQGFKGRLSATFRDPTGSAELVWFQGITYIEKAIQAFVPYYLFGRVSYFNHRPQLSHPEMELDEGEDKRKAIAPVYYTTDKLRAKGLDARGIRRLQVTLQERLSPQLLVESLPTYLTDAMRLMPLAEALKLIHFPYNIQQAENAGRRLKFEELFFLQIQILQTKLYKKTVERGYIFKELGSYFMPFYEKVLPFTLTGAQKRVLKEIRRDLQNGGHMNRLLQGDVGSGKTMVAFMTALMALDNGFQATILAPTEILAQQHYIGLSVFAEQLGVRVEFLSGSVKGKARQAILEALQSGEIHLLVGTHAILEDPVIFKKLGLAIIDEQHRFGVEQRARLWKKSIPLAPHILVMTATPIPRTLAMTLYGDLDISVIDELPPGRQPIKTVSKAEVQRDEVYKFMEAEIAKGRQIYIVYPVIEETENLDLATLQAGLDQVSLRFPLPEYAISILHGKMKAADKDFEMSRFVRGETQIMVATTVIEVGVNVPNASVMIIENTERFGLSQLHQLRGRVGRGSDQSFCILMHSYKMTTEGKARIRVMCSTNDGFVISEEDLKLRGPGDITGTQQSGMLKLRIADLAKDQAILQTARQSAETILEKDPNLLQPENHGIAMKLKAIQKGTIWGNIS
jgi:ATP-dependent DNA helicase RecG